MVAQDGTQNQGDNSSPGGAGTSEGNETFSKAQVEELVKKAKSDALSDVGRLRKASEEAIKQAQAANERLIRMQKEQEEAELEANKDVPDKLQSIRYRQQLREREAKLAQQEAELTEARTKLNEYTQKDAEGKKQSVAREIAEKVGVDSKTLVKLAKFTDGSEEAIEEIARTLPKKQNEDSGKFQFKPDDNRSKGGTSQSKYQVMKDYNSGNINAVQYAEKMKALGEQP